jgi:hypothetical protein
MPSRWLDSIRNLRDDRPPRPRFYLGLGGEPLGPEADSLREALSRAIASIHRRGWLKRAHNLEEP